MDTDTLQQAAEHAGLLALTAGFLAGLVFSFNPVALPAASRDPAAGQTHGLSLPN